MSVERVALVTGADRPLGLEIARQLADRELEVVVTAPAEAAARTAAERLWEEGLDTVHPRPLDVGAGASVEKLRGQVERDFGRLDVLVHATGPDGALRTALAFVPVMRRHRYGRVVVVASGPDDRDAVAALTRRLADESRGENVLVNGALAAGDGGDPGALRAGADTPVWLATLPDDGPRGGVFRDRQPVGA